MSEYSLPTAFIDLEAQQKRIRAEVDAAIATVLDHGHYIMGPEVKMLESRLCEFAGVEHVITCANGTDALTLVFMAWNVGKGDAVIVPSFTYVATAEAAAQLGATPFFVDVNDDDFNMNPESFKQAIVDCRDIGLKPKVVVPVDLFGQPSDVEAIEQIAREHKIKVLVDGAQSFGATSKGSFVGSMGDATTTSFFPAKPLGCYGDGGAVLTSDEETASAVRSIRLHGKGAQKYDNVRIGMNSRLDTIQAAVLLQKLKVFPSELEARSRIAQLYSNELAGLVNVPRLRSGRTSAWAQYTVTTVCRDELVTFLHEKSVPTAIYYPHPLTKQKGYSAFPVVKGGTPISERLSQSVISLPMHPYLLDQEVIAVANSVAEFANRQSRVRRHDKMSTLV